MPGPPIPVDSRRIVVRMLLENTPKDVAKFTGYSESSIRRILRVFEETGSFETIPDQAKRGRKKKLDESDVEVCYLSGFVETLSHFFILSKKSSKIPTIFISMSSSS